MKKPAQSVAAVLSLLLLTGSAWGQDKAGELREVIVSHTDDKGILQLYAMKEDGSASQQLTRSERGCRMPSVSPDGKRLAYVEQTEGSMALWISDIDGRNPRAVISEGMNLLPSWMPDSRHIVWMKAEPGDRKKDPASNSEIHLLDTRSGESRRLFSGAMPSPSPDGKKIAFVSDRSGAFRVWIGDLDGGNASLVSKPPLDEHKELKLPIEQKVPAWSPDGKSIAHWEGVEMIHMSKFTGVENRERDQRIAATFHVWVVSVDGGERRKVGRGDDPSWSPDGFVTRAFPDPRRGGPMVVVETASGTKELPIVAPGRNWGRSAWLPKPAEASK